MREPTEQCQGITKTLNDVLIGGKTLTLKITMGDKSVIPREVMTIVLTMRTGVDLKTIEEIIPLEMATGETTAPGVEALPLIGSSIPSATFAPSQQSLIGRNIVHNSLNSLTLKKCV